MQMRELAKRIQRIEKDVADPRKRTINAFVERQGLIRGIIKELKAISDHESKDDLMEKAKRLKWENPLRCFYERYKEKQIVNIPPSVIKKEPFEGGYRTYFPAHFMDFEEEGLKVSCSRVPAGYESDMHYHFNFIERVNVMEGFILLNTPGEESRNVTALQQGRYAMVPEDVSHNYNAREESIVFTEKLGSKSVLKCRDVGILNSLQSITARKFNIENGSSIQIYSRISYLDRRHSIGFILPHPGTKSEYTVRKQTFYFCLEGSIFIAKKVKNRWIQKEAASPSVTIIKPENRIHMEFTNDARVLFIADH